MSKVIVLKDGAHVVAPPTANAIIFLESLGHPFADAFETVGLAADPEKLRAELLEATEKYAEMLREAADEDAESIEFPEVHYALSITAIRDHVAALLIDAGENVTVEEVGRLLDLKRISDYAAIIRELGAEGWATEEGSDEAHPTSAEESAS